MHFSFFRSSKVCSLRYFSLDAGRVICTINIIMGEIMHFIKFLTYGENRYVQCRGFTCTISNLEGGFMHLSRLYDFLWHPSNPG